MMQSVLPSLGSAGFLYAIIIPFLVVEFIALLVIPSLLRGNAKPLEVGKAVYCYMLQGLGILLMIGSSMPVLQMILRGQAASSRAYFGLLLVFAAGGLTFLWHDNVSREIDAPSRVVPAILYWYTCKFIGYLLVLFSLLSLGITMLTQSVGPGSYWWVTPLILLGYGLIFSWCTREEIAEPFHASRMAEPPSRPPSPVGKKVPAKK